MDNYILMILKRKFNNDISNYIFNIYLIDKYFSKNLNNKSIKLFKIKFKNNRNEIIDEINYNYSNLYFIKKLILIDNSITLKIIERMPEIIRYLDYNYKNNEEIFIKIIKRDNSLIKYASQELKSNKKFMERMIDVFPASIYYAKKELKEDYELGLKAVKLDGDVIEYLSPELRTNEEIIKIAKKNSHNYFINN
jgi:hypothetical protein